MELYLLIAYLAGIMTGTSVFYFGYRLGIRVSYKVSQQLPAFEAEDDDINLLDTTD